jgi:osmotically-inducible protein OsmY
MDSIGRHIEDAVRAEIAGDPHIPHPSEIAVEVADGIATLRGTVGSFRERREAVKAAKRVSGVETVHDRLHVRLLDHDRRDDADLRGAVLQALMGDTRIPSTIDVAVKDGIVTLTGWAPYSYQRDEAELVAGNVAGVIELDDQIELTIGAPTPADVRHSINKAFKGDARLDADALSIETDEGVVTLSGHVRSWVEHDAAVNVARSVPGVVDVDDQLVVDS